VFLGSGFDGLISSFWQAVARMVINKTDVITIFFMVYIIFELIKKKALTKKLHILE